MNTFHAIGCMSGSSLDGLDLCYVAFTGENQTDTWTYRILKGITIPYTTEWGDRLRNANKLGGEDLVKLNVDYGHFIGQTLKEFIDDEEITNLDCISSHGHTIFHQPQCGYTFQLGDGETTAIYLNQPYVCNFRNKDVALGGQGAPLVPNGEKFLFNSYDICINLGGIANIGLKGLQGYDVCPCNYVSNRLSKLYDQMLDYDKDGQIAETGNVITEVLENLDALHFYTTLPPKSIDAAWINSEVLPILNKNKHSIPDLLRTYIEHITNKLTDACKHARDSLSVDSTSDVRTSLKMLVTGGGAFNKFLMKIFQEKLQIHGFEIVKADRETIEFKEALIFAFLGFRCLLNEENIMCSVTGSQSNSISGSIHRPARPTKSGSRIIRFLLQRNKV